MIERVGVVVPAHNEEDLLGACLESLMHATAGLVVPWRVVVVLDRCTDGTRSVAHQFRAVQTLDLIGGNVGMARSAGVEELLRWAGSGAGSRMWLATTDADSVVPADWLRRQVAYGDAGWEVFVGTVAVADWSMRSHDVRQRWHSSYRPTDGHGHVHGANLGCTAEAYVGAGGFPSRESDEDVALVTALADRRILRSAAPQVLTSARLDPRAGGGFGKALDDLAG
jgi:glycosyltransferase involved in cell wall biosynthesis